MDGSGHQDAKLFVLAAGGTGGHLFPAQALAEELVWRGNRVHLMTDERVREYGKSFPAEATHVVPSATITPSRPWLLPRQVLKLTRGIASAKRILSEIRPAAVVGFGGYPSLPPILAASRLNIASCIHDQNAVMGRANRFLARMADAVACSFPEPANLPASAAKKLVFTGNPVRKIALAERAAPYPPLAADRPFKLLVFGGSQGARFFADFMPVLIAELPHAVLKSLEIVQQCRAEDISRVRAAYEGKVPAFELQSFFPDLPKRIAAAHLVVCRAGASTIAELGVIGRPAIMVPLPHALDNDQLRNAESFAKAGAGWVRQQEAIDVKELAAFLTRLRYQEGELAAASRAALNHGKPDAAKRLADLAETLAAKAAAKTET